jgi:hypothetical protein
MIVVAATGATTDTLLCLMYSRPGADVHPCGSCLGHALDCAHLPLLLLLCCMQH